MNLHAGWPRRSVRVPVVHVRVVRVLVRQRPVHMAMHMRLAAIPTGLVQMLVVFVMHVQVLMFHRLMRVLVFMIFSHVQPNTKGH